MFRMIRIPLASIFRKNIIYGHLRLLGLSRYACIKNMCLASYSVLDTINKIGQGCTSVKDFLTHTDRSSLLANNDSVL